MIHVKKITKPEPRNVKANNSNTSNAGQNSKNVAQDVRSVIAGSKKFDVGNVLNKILSKYDANNGIKAKLSSDKGTNGDRAFTLENEGNYDARMHKNVSQFDPKFRALIRQIARDTVRRKILELRSKDDDEGELYDPNFTKLLDAIHATELQDVKINNFVNSVNNVKDKLNDVKQLRGTYDSLMQKLSSEEFINRSDDDDSSDDDIY